VIQASWMKSKTLSQKITRKKKGLRSVAQAVELLP
jgi:hypothetical protein